MRPVPIVRCLVFPGPQHASGGSYRIGPGTAAVFTSRAPDKDTPNEDSAALIPVNPEVAVLVVADGVGGQPSGEVASAIAVSTLKVRIADSRNSPGDLREPILSAIEDANARIIEDGGGAATTLAIVEIHARFMRPYHVGDSMILVTGQRGKVKLETVSHSPVGYAVESGILSEADAIHHEERHLVSNVVGSRDLHVSVGIPFRMSARDTLVLATDGLFDNLHKEEIVELTRRGPLPQCADKLRVLAAQRMSGGQKLAKPDDMTFILYRPEA